MREENRASPVVHHLISVSSQSLTPTVVSSPTERHSLHEHMLCCLQISLAHATKWTSFVWTMRARGALSVYFSPEPCWVRKFIVARRWALPGTKQLIQSADWYCSKRLASITMLFPRMNQQSRKVPYLSLISKAEVMDWRMPEDMPVN